MEDKKEKDVKNTAHWIEKYSPSQEGFVCSNCHRASWQRYDICPNCKAKMS